MRLLLKSVQMAARTGLSEIFRRQRRLRDFLGTLQIIGVEEEEAAGVEY